MDPNNSEQLRLSLSDDHRRRVEEFRQRHRTGVLSLVFTDMVGSTGLKQRLGDAAGTALIEEQQHLVRAVLGEFREAEEISTAGDSFFIVFIRPSDAVRFALRLLARLRARGDQPAPILVRVGLHMGEVFIQAGQDESWRDILGIQVDTASRVMSLAAGGQILLTRAVFDNARAVLRGEELAGVGPLTWLDHGPYEIKGVEEPLSICEVGETGHAPLSPPADSAKAHRCCTPDQEPVLGWRPSLDQVVPGTQWVLDEKLGEGGFGEVWRAYHKSLRRHRVFKFCFKPDRVRSLKREVTLFRLLAERSGDHPHIVRLFDVYFDEPPFYIVMEYVPGKDLVEWCRARGGAAEAPLATRLEIVAQMADALQTAHEAGIIHRDIKPANILLEKDGGAGAPHAKLTDFGIGQVVSRGVLEGRTGEGFTETLVATSHSSRSGTQIYMAPEVLAGQISSTRSDIYSLGVVLYQLLIGDFKCPLTTDWEKHVPDPLLVEDLRRCFAGNPCERFSSAAELRDNLRSLEDRRRRREEAEEAARQMARRQRTLRILWPAVVAFLALAILASLGMERAHRLQRAAEAARAALEQEQARTAAALAAAQLARDQAHRALYDSSLLNEVLRSASSEVEPLLERFRVLLMEPIRRRLGVVHDRLVPALWRPDPAWPMSTTGEMEWLNRDDILAPSLAFDSEAAFVVSNPRHEAGRLLVRAADGGEELAAMELSSGDALAYLSVATAALRRGAELVFESTAGTRLLASLPAWPAAPAPIQPRLRLVFSPCDLATRADVSPEVSAMSAAFNAEVWAHFARHPFQLGIVQPLPPVSDSPALDRSIAENVLAALHNDAFLAWAGQEDETYGEIVKTAVVNVWTGSIVFEGYFPMPSGSDPGAVVTAMCRRCEVVLYREFPAFLARLESLSPQGGRLTTGPGMVLPIGTTLVVHRPSPEGTPARAAMLKVRHSYPGGLEAWEVERTDPEPLRVGDLVATEWTPPDAIAAALAP